MSANKDTGFKKLFNPLEEKTLSVAEKLEVQKFLAGKSVATVKGGIFTANSKSEAEKLAIKLTKNIMKTYKRDDIGKIDFNTRGIKNTISKGFNQKKLDAFFAIPTVIEKGKILKIEKDISEEINREKPNKPQVNVFIAAPIQIGDDKDILFIRLRQNAGDTTRFYVHEVFNKKEIDEYIKMTIPTAAGTQATNSKVRPHGGIATYIKILKDIFDVK